MSKDTVKNYGKSIRSKLLNIAKEENTFYQTVLTRYFQERLLYRISQTRYRSNFYLKGGALMYAYERFAARPTLDIDFLGNNISNEGASIVKAFKEICSVPYGEDGVNFDVENITYQNITEFKDYHGIRLSIPVNMDTISQVMTMDIGFGDVVTPEPVDLDYPVLLEHLPSANILAYSLETVIAEKLHAVVDLADQSSRMKDYYDLYAILQNEKYKGSALLQKTYVVDFLTKTSKKNEGEVPQYLVTDSHEAIIQPDEWELVQKEFIRRKSLGRKYSGNSIFASKIICADCGGFYGAKVWQSNSKYRRTVWQCNDKFKKGKDRCSTPHLTEDEIKGKFVTAFNQLFDIKDEVIANCESVSKRFTDTEGIDTELERIHGEIEVVTELTRKCIDNNAHVAQDQEVFKKQYEAYSRRFEALSGTYESLTRKRALLIQRADSFRLFISTLKKQQTSISAFDDILWQTTVDQVTVQRDGTLHFSFYNGAIIIV